MFQTIMPQKKEEAFPEGKLLISVFFQAEGREAVMKPEVGFIGLGTMGNGWPLT